MLGRALFFSVLTATAVAAQGSDEAAQAEAPSTASLTLRINLPTYTLEVWDGGDRIREYRATIGLPEYPTPTGSWQVTRIEWNPRWVPPPTEWARGEQEIGPGKANPMGRVKLQFDDYLYVHGTSREKELGGAHSHGCVRIANADALDLARLIAARTGVLDDAQVAALERNSRRTRSVHLPRAIPLRIRYDLTVVEEDGGVVEHPDPYGVQRAGAAMR